MGARSAKNTATIARQIRFVDARQVAMESVIKTSTLWDRCRWVVQPDRFWEVVDAVHRMKLNEVGV